MPKPSSQEVTSLLLAWRQGKREALRKLVPVVYAELRRRAHNYMRHERKDHSLQTTALINEAYIRLLDYRKINWKDRSHFFAVMARLMRHILVDYARSRQSRKRGNGIEFIPLDQNKIILTKQEPSLVALDDALNALAARDKRRSRVVELRFFGGLSVEETAEVLGVSYDTVMRDWRLAKAWLSREMSKQAAANPQEQS